LRLCGHPRPFLGIVFLVYFLPLQVYKASY
jgi:hypothetical protein